jgi:hypothetical protein
MNILNKRLNGIEHKVNEPENIKDGVKVFCADATDDIIHFCNQHKIKCYGYYWKMKQFISNKHENINFNKNIPAFVFIIMVIMYMLFKILK